jgi:serine/threonine protein kinase
LILEYDFDDECWDDVSDMAKDFIKHLLVKSPKERLSAEQALQHPWLEDGNASEKKLKKVFYLIFAFIR